MKKRTRRHRSPLRRRLWSRRRQARVGTIATTIVISLHALFILGMHLTQVGRPWKADLMELLWAQRHAPLVYLLVLILTLGPLLSWIALRCRGRHRIMLYLSWLVFLGVAVLVYPHPFISMLRVILWQLR